jgi:radical SAM superfamily enzyme YgiQ (UPF0313 family)
MKFLFIYPTIGKWDVSLRKSVASGAYLPPLGILYLAKVLEDNGHTVEVVDFNAEDVSEEEIRKKIKSSDAVGMTIYTEPIALSNSKIISNLVKEVNPNIPVLIGGPHCSLFPDKAINEIKADICVIGEGELIINKIAEAIQGKRKLSTIPSIYYREGDQIKKTKEAEQIGDLDSLPFPARHLVDKYEYGIMTGVKLSKGKLTSFLASRGCPFRCRFCAMRCLLPKYQRRSIDNIAEELDEVIDAGYKTISFVDDNFLQKQDEAEKLMDFIIQKGEKLHLWIEEARVDSVNRKLYQKMRDAGVEVISFGIESGNQDVLDFYNKKITTDQIRKAVKLSKEMGFFVNASFILGAPIETKEHIENTIRFAKSIPLDSVVFYNLSYGYGTPIWDDAVKGGILKSDEYNIIANSEKGLGHLTEDELNYYNMKAYKSYYYNPRLWLRELFFALSKRDFRFFKLGFKTLFG